MAKKRLLVEGPVWDWPDTSKGTIELCRSAKGDMYFSARIENEHRRWLIYPEGEKWLNERGFIVGSKITGRIVNDLRRRELIYTLKPKGTHSKPSLPSRPLTPEESRKVKEQRREEHRRRTLANQKKREARLKEQAAIQVKPKKARPATPPMSRSFNWSETMKVDQRLGSIRSTTETIIVETHRKSSPTTDEEKS